MRLEDYIEDLEDIDFGYAEGASAQERERLLNELEDVIDALAEEGYHFPEADLAIQYFLTDPALSRTYIYGPTDLGEGKGILEQLKEMLLAE